MENFILSSFGSSLKNCQAASLSDRQHYSEKQTEKQEGAVNEKTRFKSTFHTKTDGCSPMAKKEQAAQRHEAIDNTARSRYNYKLEKRENSMKEKILHEI